MATKYPYIVSNRDFSNAATSGDPYPNIAKDAVTGQLTGELSYWVPPYNQSPPYDQSQKMEYTRWLSTLLKEIPDANGRVMIFIHGYANPWTKVIDTTSGLAAMVSHFWSYSDGRGDELLTTPLIGPVVLFDWPSTGLSYKNAQQKGLDTANLSFRSPNSNTGRAADLKRIIDDIAVGRPSTRVNIVCHSMGNYVFAKGAGNLTPGSVSLAFMNAAAIDAKSFDPNAQSETSAAGIHQCIGSGRAFIMNTSHDDALPDVSEKPNIGDSWAELGIWNVAQAKTYYPCTAGFDLSEIVNKVNQDRAENVHTAYYYIPLVLDLMNLYLNFEIAECPSEDFLSPLNHLDSMEPILIRGRGFQCGRTRTGRSTTAIT
jgi:pimeloyl-ACP methyl ester carboxylesterase